MKDVALKISYYKCYNKKPQGFDKILPINIIIGRNNTGKSTLLELIEAVLTQKDLSQNTRNNRQPEIFIKCPIPDDTIRRVFNPSTSGGDIGGNHYAFGQTWINQPIAYTLIGKEKQFVNIEPAFPSHLIHHTTKILAQLPNIFAGLIFKHIKAERQITPEPDNINKKITPNGNGATNIIQNYINKAELPSDLIEKTFLKELNVIMNPDSIFTDIVVQQIENGSWEIFLEEDKKGRIALSQSGSGLQTIILVLIYIYLIPHLEKKDLSNYWFAFEELENNLHPSLQRRLFSYIRDIAITYNTHIFITTHSNIVIDLFSKDVNSQILHITNDSSEGIVKGVKTYVEKRDILDDLDIRASDLLQSNCIVWVEGPSDRLYFNKWVELWSNSTIVEGNHYQCVFYGGRLLSHLTANAPNQDIEKYIQILVVNKNAILIMDSDKGYQAQSITSTKERICNEMKKVESYPWITKGREIENYLSLEALKGFYNKDNMKDFGKYEKFPDYLNKYIKDEGKKFLNDKVVYAERISEHLTLENLKNVYDLDDQMKYVIKLIKKWNYVN